jgi:predicted XRE-type DNA-binding protein
MTIDPDSHSRTGLGQARIFQVIEVKQPEGAELLMTINS